MKIKWIRIIWLIVFGLIIGNIITYNHAYKFTHYSKEEGIRKKPENLSIFEKCKILFWGIDNPRPINKDKPESNYTTIGLQSHEKLEGWLIEESDSKGVVILFHGYSGSKSDNLSYSEEFKKLGYTTFLIDFMGSGESEGNQTTIGYKESRDVKEAFNYIRDKYPEKEIILFGSSMGAVSIMKSIVDYEITPDKIILECPFGTMRQTVRKRFEAMGLPSFPFAELLVFYGGIQNGFNAFKHNPVDYAEFINVPSLVLSGLKDERVSQLEVETIYKNLIGEKELKILNKSGHENYLNHNKKEWLEVVMNFLSN